MTSAAAPASDPGPAWRRPIALPPLPASADVRALLPTVRVPTLVIHHTDDPFIPSEWGKDVADRIPGATYVALPGSNLNHFYEPDWRASFQEIAAFLDRLPCGHPGSD